MTKVMRRACTEIDEILKYMPRDYVEKVPMKFRRMFYDARLLDYQVKIIPNRTIQEQNIAYETRIILTILKLNYWCNSEEEKKAIEKKLEENEIRIADQYDISKLHFQKNHEASEKCLLENSNNVLPVKQEKQSWILRVWTRIRNIFKRG